MNMRKCTIASMNYEEFLEEFIPTAESPTESTRYRLEDALSDAEASWPPLVRSTCSHWWQSNLTRS